MSLGDVFHYTNDSATTLKRTLKAVTDSLWLNDACCKRRRKLNLLYGQHVIEQD